MRDGALSFNRQHVITVVLGPARRISPGGITYAHNTFRVVALLRLETDSRRQLKSPRAARAKHLSEPGSRLPEGSAGEITAVS
jgi:hypothetical protein